MKRRPYYLLNNFLQKIPKGKVLDLGSGNGKNSLFLAKKGFIVHAIDINPKAIEIFKRESKKEKLKIRIVNADIRKFSIKENAYDSILAINSLIFMRKTEFKKTITQIKKGLKNGGVVIISGFTIRDSSYLKFKKRYKPVGKHTFKDSDKQYWQFLSEHELKSYFLKNFQILFYSERKIRDSVPYHHIHGIAELVAKKIKKGTKLFLT